MLGSELDVLLSPNDNAAVRQVLRGKAGGFQGLVRVVNAVDLRQAEAWSPVDKANIMQWVEGATPGGFEAVNHRIRLRLSTWMSEEAFSYHESLQRGEAARTIRQPLVRLLQHLGPLVEESLYGVAALAGVASYVMVYFRALSLGEEWSPSSYFPAVIIAVIGVVIVMGLSLVAHAVERIRDAFELGLTHARGVDRHAMPSRDGHGGVEGGGGLSSHLCRARVEVFGI